MKTFALSTGSCGNCFYVENKNGKVKCLIDLGLSFKKIKKFLDDKNVNINEVNYVFITHEHSDHILGLEIFLKNTSCVVYMSNGTFNKIDFLKKYKNRVKFIKNKDILDFKNFKVLAIKSIHDAVEPLSFVFFEDNKRIGFFTDLGEIDIFSREQIKLCDIIYLEANYCEDFLRKNASKFNMNYVNRLLSKEGHLGVNQLIEELEHLTKEGQKIILSHISENTNSYYNTYKKFKDKINSLNMKVELLISFQGEPTIWIE